MFFGIELKNVTICIAVSCLLGMDKLSCAKRARAQGGPEPMGGLGFRIVLKVKLPTSFGLPIPEIMAKTSESFLTDFCHCRPFFFNNITG